MVVSNKCVGILGFLTAKSGANGYFFKTLRARIKNITPYLWGTNTSVPVDIRGYLIFTTEKKDFPEWSTVRCLAAIKIVACNYQHGYTVQMSKDGEVGHKGAVLSLRSFALCNHILLTFRSLETAFSEKYLNCVQYKCWLLTCASCDN